jgi:Ca2+-binding RTX toxin-like protein
MFGGEGNDFLDANHGSDILDGGNGNDTLNGGPGADSLVGGNDDDLLIGGSNGPDGDLADTLLGGAGNDVLLGGLDNDSLLGGTGHDSLSGQAGNDTLQGWDSINSSDYDTLTGGSDADNFILGDATGVGYTGTTPPAGGAIPPSPMTEGALITDFGVGADIITIYGNNNGAGITNANKAIIFDGAAVYNVTDGSGNIGYTINVGVSNKAFIGRAGTNTTIAEVDITNSSIADITNAANWNFV